MLSDNIQRDENGVLHFAGHDLPSLAEQYGTPAYLMDEDRIRSNCRMYRDAFRTHFPEGSLPLYASKACAFRQIDRLMAQEGMGLDVVSAGELHTALSADFPPERIYFHGNCKTDEEIRYALREKVGCFIVDNEDELLTLQREAAAAGIVQKIQLRVTPGIDPHTYAAVNTGMVDSKFGEAIETGQAAARVRQALEQPNLRLTGLHCHVGSMVFDEDVFERTADVMLGFMDRLRREQGFTAEELNLGGGYGVRYRESDRHLDIPARISEVAARLNKLCLRYDYPMPRILMEPGRSIVADAGMTLYTVQSVKRLPGYKNYAAVDGGMGDNPRYALYEAPYTALAVEEKGSEQAVYDLVGRFCESGDVIQPEVSLPADLRRGRLLAVCTTGAYNYSMAFNYNRVGRPPVIMLTRDGSYIAVRRETLEDLTALDM